MDKISLWQNFIGKPSYNSFESSITFLNEYEHDGVVYEYYTQTNGVDGEGKTTFQEVVVSRPKNLSGKAPAVVIPFYFAELMLGFDPKTGKKNENFGVYPFASELSKLGFITISAEAYHLTYIRDDFVDRTDYFRWVNCGSKLIKDHPNWSGMGKLISDTKLLVDFLVGDDRVDGDKIAIMGHSLGGKMAFYTGCLDKRIKVIVASDFGILYHQTNWKDVWYWGDQLEEINKNGLSHKDLLEHADKKPFCLIAGQFDNDDSRDFLYSIPCYKDNYDKLLVIDHKTGHTPPPYARDAAYSFIKYHLFKGE